MKFAEQRKYIHDLANSFSIIDASVNRALALLNKNHPELKDEIQRIQKADEYIKKSIETLKAMRENIHFEMNAEKDDGRS